MNTFADVFVHVSALTLDTASPHNGSMFTLPGPVYVSIDTGADGDIYIEVYEDEDAEESIDGGGIIDMNDAMELDDLTPEELATLAYEKALYAWELCYQ